MDAILNLLTADQLESIIAVYGSVSNWIGEQAGLLSITIEDVML